MKTTGNPDFVIPVPPRSSQGGGHLAGMPFTLDIDALASCPAGKTVVAMGRAASAADPLVMPFTGAVFTGAHAGIQSNQVSGCRIKSGMTDF